MSAIQRRMLGDRADRGGGGLAQGDEGRAQTLGEGSVGRRRRIPELKSYYGQAPGATWVRVLRHRWIMAWARVGSILCGMPNFG